jgi:hypothetical protein
MRFLADGPSIPDELLEARDQGRVVFFCGAGVSRARAKLPDFFGLAQKVVASLRVSEASAAYKLIQEAREIDKRIGVSGVISADRVFGLLEADFSPRDIAAAVANSLMPASGCDLCAHNTLLDLATGPDGSVKLVTTNFDRLFDDCGRGLNQWQPPRLPDPRRPSDMSGIIYLHGRATEKYDGAEGEDFVLSSSEFGRAYLSDGWATTFIRDVLQRYVVVFVGYTADDPPVQYLLEALRKASGKIDNTYAFQSGEHNDATARWRHKGVEAIPYDVDREHSALWRSLEAWAERARNPQAWRMRVIDQSKRGPALLHPHERGQVAHIVSTYEGAKSFSEGDNPPPAEWLCVFDPNRRFAEPGNTGSFGKKGPHFDPFDSFSLDSDPRPQKVGPDDPDAKREMPNDAWDAFRATRLDRISIREEHLGTLRGYSASTPARLVPRIAQLGVWLAKISDQPAAVWWATHQISLHRDIQQSIEWAFNRSDTKSSPDIRRDWRFLFECWARPKNDFYRDWHELKSEIGKDGWNSAVVRRFGKTCQPYLIADTPYWGGPKPPCGEASFSQERILRRDVKYPEAHEKIDIPADWRIQAIVALRQNLELALTLETEIGGYGLDNISPIVPDNDRAIDGFNRTHGLSAAVLQLADQFSLLVGENAGAARREFACWPIDDDTIFARLRIWAVGKHEIASPLECARLFKSLSDRVFWGERPQRDLLLVLAKRWGDLTNAQRRQIESRLLKGPKRWSREKSATFRARSAWSVLNRVHWLAHSGCKFSFDIGALTATLRTITPDWKPDYAEKASASLESRGGWVRTDDSHDALIGVPLSSLLKVAKEGTGRSDEPLVKNDPFGGFVSKYPVRAFSALRHSAKRGDFAEWAWRSFLTAESRKTDGPRFKRLIGERLAGLSEPELALVIRPASDWLSKASAELSESCLPTFDRLVGRLVEVLRTNPDQGRSGIVRSNRNPDWTTEAINSPAGDIAESLFHDPRKNDLERGHGFPKNWLKNVELVLSLSGDLRRFVLVIFYFRLNWFFAIDPDWSEHNLLPAVDGKDHGDKDAAWSGFLWSAQVPDKALYARLESDLLKLATDPFPSRRSFSEIIAGMILAGWASLNEDTGQTFVSDNEIHALLIDVDDAFRSRILWQIEQWSDDDKPDSDRKWSDRVPELLKIWPRQLSARSPNTSARLCELAFSSDERFPEIVDLILPVITKIDRDHMMLPELRRSGPNIVDRYPEKALALLHAVLPDSAAAWPYAIEGTIERIGKADKALLTDDRLIALKRRWDAR